MRISQRKLTIGVLPLAFLFTIGLASSFASDDCIHKVWKWRVDKKAALDLQQSVNEGHQPWRMDDIRTIAGQAIDERKKEWADYNTVLGLPELISQTKDRALMVARSEDGSIRYEVVLRKYSWLLQAAGGDRRWIIWLPAEVQRIDCRDYAH